MNRRLVIILGIGLLALLMGAAAVMHFRPQQVTAQEHQMLKSMSEHGGITIQIRRFDGKKNLTWGNPSDGIFHESTYPGDAWKPGTIVYLHIFDDVNEKMVANIMIPADQLGQSPSIESVWAAARNGSYYYIDRELLR